MFSCCFFCPDKWSPDPIFALDCCHFRTHCGPPAGRFESSPPFQRRGKVGQCMETESRRNGRITWALTPPCTTPSAATSACTQGTASPSTGAGTQGRLRLYQTCSTHARRYTTIDHLSVATIRSVGIEYADQTCRDLAQSLRPEQSREYLTSNS